MTSIEASMLHMWRGGIGYGVVVFMGLQPILKFGVYEDIWGQMRMAFSVFFVQGCPDRLILDFLLIVQWETRLL